MGAKENNFFSNLFSTYETLPFDRESFKIDSVIQERLDKVNQKINGLDVLIKGGCSVTEFLGLRQETRILN